MTPVIGKYPAGGTSWGIAAEWRPRPVAGTYVRVTDGLLPDPEQRNLVPLRVQASSQWAPLLANVDYEQPFLRAHARRLASGGQAKGRVLYLRGNRSPLAALCWSLPPSGHPIYVIAAAPARSFARDAQDAATAIELLLSCLGAIADEIGGERPLDQLGWAVPRSNRENENRVARTLSEQFGFRGVKRSDHPRHIRRFHAAHYLLRGR